MRIDPTLAGRLPLFPLSTQVEGNDSSNYLSIEGISLAELANQHGTPLYVYHQETLEDAVGQYIQALEAAYPAQAGITYAGKAFLCLGIAQWTKQRGLWLDCSGAGELEIARAAGIPRQALVVHGVNKSQEDLTAAVELAGTIVVDNLGEMGRLASLKQTSNQPFPDLWLRLRPGRSVDTHAYTQTGQEEDKFGLSAGEFLQAISTGQDAGLKINGLHFHLGSNFRDPSPLVSALEITLDLIAETKRLHGWSPEIISPGGGWGVAYHEDQLPHPDIESYVRIIAKCLREGCEARGLPLPRLQLEPGRSLAARAGVAIYRIGTEKHTGKRRWLLVDGGLADNPRPALYQARYSALPLEGLDRPVSGPAWLAGPYCESGDWMIADLMLPELEAGEFIAVPVSGAYQLSMASNYNGARKPAVLWLEHGRASLLQRRETTQELLSRDFPLPLSTTTGS